MSDVIADAQMAGIAKRARIALQRSKSTRTMLQGHIDECASKQRWVIRIGAVTLAWVVLHSPEAAKAALEIAKVLYP